MVSYALSQIPDAPDYCDAPHEKEAAATGPVSNYFTFRVKAMAYYVNWGTQNQLIVRLARCLHALP